MRDREYSDKKKGLQTQYNICTGEKEMPSEMSQNANMVNINIRMLYL